MCDDASSPQDLTGVALVTTIVIEDDPSVVTLSLPDSADSAFAKFLPIDGTVCCTGAAASTNGGKLEPEAGSGEAGSGGSTCWIMLDRAGSCLLVGPIHEKYTPD